MRCEAKLQYATEIDAAGAGRKVRTPERLPGPGNCIVLLGEDGKPLTEAELHALESGLNDTA